jgi:hypothetical protein
VTLINEIIVLIYLQNENISFQKESEAIEKTNIKCYNNITTEIMILFFTFRR